MLFGQWVSHSGHRFAQLHRRLPGTLPGAGYDYNDFWGGALRRSEHHCEKEQNLSNNSRKLSYDPICPITHRFPDRLLFSSASTGTDRVQANDIYINLAPRTAIILPSLEEHWRQLKSKIPVEQAKGALLAKGNDPDLPRDTAPKTSPTIEDNSQSDLHADRLSGGEEDQTAEMIVGLTRDCITENGEVAFLDVGCNTGELLSALKARTKWKLFGLEASPSAASEAISKGHRVFEASLEKGADLITRCFDLVFLGHRFEGFAEPRMSLRSLALLLNPGGLLILSTPNLDSEQLKLHGPAWAHWKPAEQRFIYSKKSLKLILSLAGFRVVKLSTVSWLNATALPLKRFSESATIANSADQANMKSTRQMELIAGKRSMVVDPNGKGDVSFAICERLF